MFRDIGRVCKISLYKAHAGVTTPFFQNVLIPSRSQGYNSARTFSFETAMVSAGAAPTSLTGVQVSTGDAI